jgi:long-chain fatty acid transport protein
MKRTLIVALSVLALVSVSSATLVTNNNQSAFFLRLPSRAASLDLDAVYYNPAGLVLLKDGWHFGLNNQSIWQTKTVNNGFPFLNEGTYDGQVKAPVFPGIYAAYKKGPLALSFAFNPVAGGGSAEFLTGLPSFEWNFSALPGMITGMGIPTTKYSADIYFKGTSVYFGFQFNVSYALGDSVSAAIGGRYVSAKNTYLGHIRSVSINPTMPALGMTGSMITAKAFFTTMQGYYAQIGNPVGAATMGAYASQMGDREVDAEQTAGGFTPILSLDFHPMENLNIAVKYEAETKLEFTNKPAKDDVGMFPTTVKPRLDIPAFLSVGANYGIVPGLRATASFDYFFDKSSNRDGLEKLINSNTWDLAFGLEYDISDFLLVSAGYLITKVDVADGYQEDLGFDLSADTIAGGFRVKLSPKLDIDLGVMNVTYKDYSKMIAYASGATPLGSYKETYSQKTFAFAIGLNIHL